MAETDFPLTPTTGEASPLPFEDRGAIPGFWTRLGLTFRLAFTAPMEFFERLPRTASLGAPWRLLLLFSIPLYLFLLLYAAILGGVALIASLEANARQGWVPAVICACLALGLLALPLLQFLGMLVGGALNHLFLWLWGGTRQGVGLRQTIRTTGYVKAFMTLACLVPPVALFAFFGGWVLLALGLARVHRTDTWRAVAAMATHFLCWCLLLGGLVFACFLWALRQEQRERPAAIAPTVAEPLRPDVPQPPRQAPRPRWDRPAPHMEA